MNYEIDTPFSREKLLGEQLESAINYYVENVDFEELEELITWYKAENITELKKIMYDAYLDNYNTTELKEEIKKLEE